MLLFDQPGAGAFAAREPLEDNVLSQLSVAPDTLGASVAAMTANAAASAEPTSDQVLARVLESLDDDKAEDIVQIDLRGRSSIADHMVICSGRSSRQVGAIAEKLVERLKEEFGRPCKIEGKDQGDWVLIDASDVIVHVFRPEVREFYQLEKMWMPAGSQV